MSKERSNRHDLDRQQAEREHMDLTTGWLSVEIINVLAQHHGIHVSESPCDKNSVWKTKDDQEAAVSVNCNNQRWTVLQRRARTKAWVHINSIVGSASYEGPFKYFHTETMLQGLFHDLAFHYDACTLHRITKGDLDAALNNLEPESRRALLPQEEVEVGNGLDDRAARSLRLVTLNVDGCTEYGNCPAADRLEVILEKLLRESPDVIHEGMHDVVGDGELSLHLLKLLTQDSGLFLRSCGAFC